MLVYGHGRREEDHDPGVVRPRAGVVDNAVAGVGHQGSHLAPLANLQGLQNLQVVVRLSIISLNAAFLGSECRILLTQPVHSGHSGKLPFVHIVQGLFKCQNQTGPRLTSLKLSGVDEMNLAALVMIGDHSPFLEHLAISCCHYTQVGKEFLFECLIRQRKGFSKFEALKMCLFIGGW